jgi:hypothetical protein
MHVLANQPAAAPCGCRHGRNTRRRCRVVVAAAADEALCRDKVSAPKDLRGESRTTCVVNFKGADGRVLPVEMPEVRCGGVCCYHVADVASTPSVYASFFTLAPYLAALALKVTCPRLCVVPRRHPQDMYILNAAEGAGIDLPATCRGGICGCVVPLLARGCVPLLFKSSL